ncbi:hypothetical protein K5K93_12465 [Stenotrophomonas sp. DR822]|uniref:hypothetical protein n=1 Tax=Stenotrophomonas sp. DR822 TaxID=2871174 RepID=UPI001C96F6B3|nr:hypothetical protein [Stenotrophomonas sp. DR822]QZN82948.1 hypothetical protein K5K93_12465 [Stenotrophomonas sp. DR822]
MNNRTGAACAAALDSSNSNNSFRMAGPWWCRPLAGNFMDALSVGGNAGQWPALPKTKHYRASQPPSTGSTAPLM